MIFLRLIFITLLSLTYSTILSPQSHAQIDFGKQDIYQPVEITSDRLNIIRPNETATFSGDVNAIQGDLTIRSKTITVHYRDKASQSKNKSSQIREIVAEDDFVLTTKLEKASADKGIYNFDARLITLIGNVSLKKGKNTINGSKLVYNLDTGMSTLINSQSNSSKERVRGVFVPQ